MKELSDEQKFAISYKGSTHLQLASRNSVYFYQMALTTPILCAETTEKIKTVYKTNVDFMEKVKSIKNIFSEYLINEDKKYVVDINNSSKYENQSVLIKNILGFGDKPITEDDPVSTFGNVYKNGTILRGVDAVVDTYDVDMQHGIALIDQFPESIHFDQNLLTDLGVTQVFDGDILYCDIARNDNGIYIEKVHYLVDNSENTLTGDCEITRYFQDRGYGFCVFDNGGKKDAFFNRAAFDKSTRQKLREGYKFKAEIVPSQKGNYQVRKVLGKIACS